MNFRPVNVVARWSGVAAFVSLALSAAAQQTTQQTIQFTRPVDQDLSGKANSFMPTTSRRNSAGAFNAPSPLFGERNPVANFDALPGSPVPNAAAAANAAQWRKFLEGKKNWTLMTPEEILGIPTPEKILGIPDPRDDPKLSAEERFLQRREQREAAGATNALRRPDASHRREDSANPDASHPADGHRRSAQMPGDSTGDPTKNLNLLFNNLNPNLRADLNRKPDSVWASSFGLPEPLPKPTPEQLEGMDRFRALMEPFAPEKTPEAARLAYQQPVAAPNPNMQAQPAFNPAGSSFKALESGIGKPTGITPLPGLTGPHPAPAKKTPALVQPPPWMSDSPQPFAAPQRQF